MSFGYRQAGAIGSFSIVKGSPEAIDVKTYLLG